MQLSKQPDEDRRGRAVVAAAMMVVVVVVVREREIKDWDAAKRGQLRGDGKGAAGRPVAVVA